MIWASVNLLFFIRISSFRIPRKFYFQSPLKNGGITLDDIEAEGSAENSVDMPGFHALELPAVIQEVVDDLQPLLSPYEAAFYWYAFRHSIAKNGNPHVRLSTRGHQRGIVKSSYSTAIANQISLDKVREIFRALEAIGALRKEGEPNRDGTPYRVLTPDEIPACREYRSQRLASTPPDEIAPSDLDFYNVRENRRLVFERDEYKCRYCQKQLTRFTATLDHVTPVAEGGNNGLENLVTACLNCNSQKHRRPVSDFLAERSS
jgi:hypothetical protein